MAEKKEVKETLKEQFERLEKELGKIDFEEDREAYDKKADELGAVGKKYFAEKVKLKLPRARADEERFQTIIWNGTRFEIERGKEVEVPRGVALIYEDSEAQEEVADEYMRGLADDYDELARRM